MDKKDEKQKAEKKKGGLLRAAARLILIIIVASVGIYGIRQVVKKQHVKTYETDATADGADAGNDAAVAEDSGEGEAGKEEADFEIEPLSGEASDYSDVENWLRIPKAEKEVDTFFIYPTIVTDTDPDAPQIMPIDDPVMRLGAEGTYLKDAMAFEKSTNVFVPFYRQSNMAAIADLREDELIEFHKQEQRTDIYGALDYYFEHFNEGRPFILAGHSQGSIMSKIVLEEYMQAHPDYYERMVAAYLVGFSVTKRDLKDYPYLKFAQGEDDTGVVISWNTEGPGNKDADNIVVLKDAVSINPINWKLDDTYAPADENLGSRIDILEDYKFDEKRPGLADAQVDTERGVVVCRNEDLPHSTTDGDLPDVFGPDSFHRGDYAFFYFNVEENVGKRVKAYLEKEQ